MTQKRTMMCRSKEKAKKQKVTDQSDVPPDQELYDKLVADVVSSLRGKREYTYSYAEWVTKVGSIPSDGGSRSPLAAVISQVSDIVTC